MSEAGHHTFVSYWDTPESPAEEETLPASHPPVVRDAVSLLKGAQELDPNQQHAVDLEVLDPDEGVVEPVEVPQVPTHGGRRGGGGRGRGRGRGRG